MLLCWKVLQERLLSPRVLHFSDNQMYWECNNLEYYECASSGLPPSGNILHGHELPKALLRFQLASEGSKPFHDSSMLQNGYWFDIVGAFTDCSITYADDRFAAISGIVEQLRMQSGDECVAGIWRKDALRHLCWQCRASMYDRPNCRILPKIHAPSWSWLSCNHQVNFSFSAHMNHAEANILELKGDLFGKHYFGEIEDAQLSIEGHLLPITFDADEPRNDPSLGHYYTSRPCGLVFIDGCEKQKAFEADRDNVRILPLLSGGFGRNFSLPNAYLYNALVLLALPGTKYYERIGLLTSYSRSMDPVNVSGELESMRRDWPQQIVTIV